jgi:hypothetical protein
MNAKDTVPPSNLLEGAHSSELEGAHSDEPQGAYSCMQE